MGRIPPPDPPATRNSIDFEGRNIFIQESAGFSACPTHLSIRVFVASLSV
jgi:hypothetical protein